MLDDQPFYSAGSDKNNFEIITRQLVHILIVDEFYGIIFFKFTQNRFV